MGTCYTNMAGLAQATGQASKARDYARKAVKILDNVGLPVQEALREAAGM